MDRASAVPVGTSSRYAVLAANVSKVVVASSGRTLEPAEKKLMDRAADLLGKIVEGSQFIEHSEAHALSKPRENLFAFDHAISALRKVDISRDAEIELTKIFGLLQQDLHRLASDEDIEGARRIVIRAFFDALGELFYRDIADSSVMMQETDFERTLV
jgi:hypothetical protein